MLQTITVEESTLVLLKKIQQIPLLNNLCLVGGTALALQLGHRHSIDLDFFGTFDLSSKDIEDALKNTGLEVSFIQGSSKIYVFIVNGIKVDFVNYSIEWFDLPIETEGVRMADLKDIAAMKLEAIGNRGKKKDFIDIYFLLQHFSLKQMFEFYTKKYSSDSLFHIIRSLTYFADAEEDAMPKMFIDISWEDIKSTIRKTIEDF
jgi:predicted nucleotidyltransferase component of viral defense system